jgi:radical SAM superfamily enzyme YgiQ (UPF0313 family)
MKVLLVVYDNDSYIHWFPQGLSYIAAVLLKHGHDVQIYNQDKYHYDEEHLTSYLDSNDFDVIGVGIIAGYYQYRKVLNISGAINRSKNRPFYVIGGHGPSPEPEFFLKKTGADAIVIGEGELTIIALLEAISGRKSLININGIAFMDSGKFMINDKRALIKDVDSIPFPAFRLFPIDYYKLLRAPHSTNKDFVIPVLSGRGCTFNCNFCYRMDQGFRPRSPIGVIEEIKYLKTEYGISYVIFSDELLMSSESRTIELCESFIRSGLNVKWSCNGRLNYAKPEILRLMKRSGCLFINYGIEAMDDIVLKNMNKALNTDIIMNGIRATLDAGISPGFNIIFGNIGDNLDSLNKGVEFLLKYDDGAQMRTIRPVTPYPGSQLYSLAIEKGLLKDAEDFYEHKHINSDLLAVNFTDISDDQVHAALFEANQKLIDMYFYKKRQAVIAQAKKLYLERDGSFRGFRHT